MPIDVTALNPQQIIYGGQAYRVVVPGEEGVFEILPYHKRIVSRLISGTILIDEEVIPIRRGVVKVDQNRVTIILEEQ